MTWYYRYQKTDKEFSKIEEGPLGALSSQKVRIRPIVVGVCGSDLSQIGHELDDPAIGHEWVGEVIEVAQNVQNFKVGDLVTSVANTACGQCPTCEEGRPQECQRRQLLGRGKNSVLSSEIILDECDLLMAPQGLSAQEITLLEVAYIGDCAYHRAKGLGLKESDRVLILGAGPIGLFSGLSFKEHGLNPIVVEKVPERISLAQSLGLEVYAFAQVMLDSKYLEAFDVVVDCTGNNGGPGAIQVAPLFTKKEGAVVIVGKYLNSTFPEERFMKRAIRVTWVANHSREAFLHSLDFWKEKISKYALKVIKTFPSSAINEAFTEAQERKVMKCMVDFTQS